MTKTLPPGKDGLSVIEELRRQHFVGKATQADNKMSSDSKSFDSVRCARLSRLKDGALITGSFLIFILILFHNLGAPALFEPDEGRNAEIAREILVTRDWVTPHNNFVPVLDKPVFFYWLVALCYKLFGVSEWSARLPSALAGLGSLVVVYLFAKKFLGDWEALWSVLILVTSVEFFLLSRIVIFDMSLTFFVTLALCSFYCGMNSEHRLKRRIFFLSMYGAMGVATLIKGPIGLILPGMVIFSYMLVSRRWRLLTQMNLIAGMILFFLIVIPWYAWAEVRNPGYLRYFLWEENVVRYLTPHFQRSQPWYYFVVVLFVGLLPWTLLIPAIVKGCLRKYRDDKILFLLLWAALPFLFFSLSSSKLPHYILPIYVPISILAGDTVLDICKGPAGRRRWLLALPWLILILILSTSMPVLLWPRLLPDPIREPFVQVSRAIQPEFVLLVILVFTLIALLARKRWEAGQIYLFHCVGLVLFILLMGQVMESVSSIRSSRELATKSAALLDGEQPVALYDTYLSSLPFYLRITRPISVVWSGHKKSIMGSFYVAEERPEPKAGYGKALLTFKEFAQEWNEPGRAYFAFLEAKDLPGFEELTATLPERLLQVGKIVLVANHHQLRASMKKNGR